MKFTPDPNAASGHAVQVFATGSGKMHHSTDAHCLQFSIACRTFHGAVGKAHMVENRWNRCRGRKFCRDLLGAAFRRSASTQQGWSKQVQSGTVIEPGVLAALRSCASPWNS